MIEATKKGGEWKKTVLASRNRGGKSCSSRKGEHKDRVISVAPV